MESSPTEEDFITASAFFTQPPNLVSLSPFTPSVPPSPRRLSSCYSQPSQPIKAKRQLAWVSLQGRLVGAEEASSAKKIGGGLNAKEAVVWELFSPIHRILIVAVVAVAATNSKKNKEILRLKKSVELRDQVLLGMQQKLDTLCEQVNYFKDQPEIAADTNGCFLCEQHLNQLNNFYENMMKGAEVFTYETPPAADQAEQDERRMSDLSDWAGSVTSSVDTQLNTLAVEQDFRNLRKECEEKDAAIKELSTFLQSSEAFGAKRIGELEDIIHRKNTIITKLKKDILILEQKVVNLTRLRRPSFSSTSSKVVQLPTLTDNIVYDMDSTTSPSSSDSDSSPRRMAQALSAKSQDIPVKQCESALRQNRKEQQAESCLPLMVKPTDRRSKSRSVSPLKEKSLNQTQDSVSKMKPKQVSSVSAETRRRRPPVAKSKNAVTEKRWL